MKQEQALREILAEWRRLPASGRRPQRPGRRRLSGARRPQGAGAGAPRTGGRLRGHRRDLARLSRLHRRLPHQPAAGAHRPRAGLPRFGYRVDAKDPAFFSAFPDGRHFFMWQDRAKTLAEIARFSPHDAEVYPAYEDQLERLSQVVEGLLLTTPPRFPPRAIDFVDYLKLAGRCAAEPARSGGAGQDLHAERRGVPGRVVRIREVKVTLATDGVIGANGGPRSPGTAYILLHHCMGGVAGHRGLWGFVRGGMGAVSEAIAASARAPAWRSAPMRRSRGAGARRPRARRGAGKRRGDRSPHGGVQSRSQAHLPAPARPRAISTRSSSAAIRNFRIEGTSCKINLALNGLPEFTAYPGAPGPHHRATMHICPSIDYVERAWDDAKYGRPSERPLLELTIPPCTTRRSPRPASTSWASSCNTRPTRCAKAPGTNCASPSATA
jgi:phytoene dehydrogenase-like protein